MGLKIIFIIAFVGIFFNGRSQFFRAKDLKPMIWRDRINIVQAKKELFTFGLLQMILSIVCIGVNFLEMEVGIFNTILGVITVASSIRFITMCSGIELISIGIFGILFGIQVLVHGIGTLVFEL